MKKNVLFISSSIGLGHAARDVAIVREIRKRNPNIEVSWLAGDPARRVIEESGDTYYRSVNCWAKIAIWLKRCPVDMG